MTAALLAALLRRAFPGLRVLDRAVATGGLWPWWPEAALALADPEALPEAERRLLQGFGLGPGDPALAAGAPDAWGGEGPRLVVTRDDAEVWLAAGAWVLTDAATPPPVPRILLLIGCGGAVEQRHLLLPEGALPAALAALAAGAAAMAGPGWDWAGRPVTERLATLTLFAPAAGVGVVSLPAAVLPHWRETPGRLRVLLGVLPPCPLRIQVAAEGAPALLLDGAAHDPGAAFTPLAGAPVVLGLAGTNVVLRAVTIGPA